MNTYIYEDVCGKLQKKNDYADGPFRRWTWFGFDSKEEAEFFCSTWEQQIGWGYSPSAIVSEENGNYVVYARIARSCD